MPMFFFAWDQPDADGEPRASLIVDERDKPRALKIATAHHGARPSAGREFPPGVFACEVFFNPIEDLDADELEDAEPSDADREAGDMVVPELLPHVEAACRMFEDQCSDEAERVGAGPVVFCADECEGPNGEIVRCARHKHGDEIGHQGGGLTW